LGARTPKEGTMWFSLIAITLAAAIGFNVLALMMQEMID
jgi:hypothetical protein